MTPRLVQLVRDAIDHCWMDRALRSDQQNDARAWCQRIKIIVSGGFDELRIGNIESKGAPVDAYGVGSALLAACPSTFGVTDFSAGIVAVVRKSERIAIAKRGRDATWTNELREIRLIGG